MNCEWVKSNVTLFIYDELADGERYELEQHVERCSVCAGELMAAREFKAAMSALPQLEPTPNLLTASRMKLQESLEETTQVHGWRRLVFDPTAWLRQMRFAPALAMVLFIVGFAAGVGTTYRIASGGKGNVLPNITGTEQTPNEASIAGIRGITQDPGTNRVDINYDTVVQQSAQGSLDDPKIQQLLLLAARNNNNSGVRMDSVDLLTKQSSNEGVREALMFALRYDNNPGVRMKALDGLGSVVKEDIRVRNAVLEALMNDSNPGVRTAAIQLLKPVNADSSVRQVLQRLADEDQSAYIRSQSRAMLASAPQIY